MHCRSDYKAAELSTFVSQVSCHISGLLFNPCVVVFLTRLEQTLSDCTGCFPPTLFALPFLPYQHSCHSTRGDVTGVSCVANSLQEICPATTWSPQHHMAGINSKRTSGYSSFPVFPVPEMGPKPPCSHGYYAYHLRHEHKLPAPLCLPRT